jgi:hypothetical protein
MMKRIYPANLTGIWFDNLVFSSRLSNSRTSMISVMMLRITSRR